MSNVALAIAIGNGVSIAWWRRALRGATVTDLHKSWAYSNSLLELLTAGRNFNIIALAAITAKLALVDNILLQRSANTRSGTFEQTVDGLKLPIVSTLPEAYAGQFNKDGSSGALSGAFSSDVYYYSSDNDLISLNSSLYGFDTKCEGTCTTFVKGFGFNVSCTPDQVSTSNVTKTIAAANTFDSIVANNGTSGDGWITLLTFSAAGLPAGDPYTLSDTDEITLPYDSLYFYAQYSSLLGDNVAAGDAADTCTATISSHVCFLQPAVVEYPIQITNISNNAHATNGISLIRNPNQSFSADTAADENGVLQNGQIWGIEVLDTIAGSASSQTENINSIGAVLNNLFSATTVLEYTNSTGYVATASGNGPLSAWWVGWYNSYRSSTSCVMDVVDPTTFVIRQLNSLMLRASISAAINPVVTDANGDIVSYNVPIESDIVTVSGNRTVDTVVYQSEYGYMAGAISIMFVCVLCVLPAYYGFWELGRKVTLGPVEIASAFRAPVLEHPAAAAGGEVDTLLKEVGDRRLKYGKLEGTGKLGIAEPEVVQGIIEPTSNKILTKESC